MTDNTDKKNEQSYTTVTRKNSSVENKVEKPVYQKYRRPQNSITNFKFKEVLNCATPVKNTDFTVLLQYLVAHSKINGKFELYKVLNTVLAASNHECELPIIRRYRPQPVVIKPMTDPTVAEPKVE